MKKCNHDFVWIEEIAATEGYSQCKKCPVIKGSKEYWYEQFQNEQGSGAEGQLETDVSPEILTAIEFGYKQCEKGKSLQETLENKRG